MRVAFCLKSFAAAFAAFLLPSAAPTYAGGPNCLSDCYEEAPAAPIHRTFKRRVELRRGVYAIEREPSLYGWSKRRVLLDDVVEWREKPAVYKTVKVRKHLKSRITWQKRWIGGKHILCKVHLPSRTVWTTKKILVSPARRWKVRSKPVYGYVEKRILLIPYKNIAVYHRAHHKYVREHVVIQPENTVWVPISAKYKGE